MHDRLTAEKQQRRLPGLIIMLVALGSLLAAAVMIFLPFVTPIALALVIATIANPLLAVVLKWVGVGRRGLAAAVTCLALVILVFGPVTWVGWSMAKQARAGIDVVENGLVKLSDWAEGKSWFQSLKEKEWFQSYWQSIEQFLSSREPSGADREPAAEPAATPSQGDEGAPSSVSEKAFPLGVNLARWITRSVAGLISNAFEVLLKFLLMLFILFYFFKDGPQILRSIRSSIPLDESYQEKVAETFQQVSQSIIRGSFLTALAQGAVAAVAYAIVGVPAVFWGVMTAFCALIPPIGTSLVTLPLTIFVFLGGDWGKGIFLAVVAVAIGGLDNIIRPLFVGGSLRMHPIWLLLSILGAVRLFGPLGLIYGPLVLVLIGTFMALLVREGPRAGLQSPMA